MLNMNRYALKEWAAVCEALARGRQSLLLRKGGIDEGPQGFRVEHSEFWLYPTQFHQSAEQLAPGAEDLAALAETSAPPHGRLHLRLHAVVEGVVRVSTLEQLHSLSEMHVLSAATVESRFHYRTPGLFALLTRVYAASRVIDIPERAVYAGCRSWVELGEDLETSGLAPVLEDVAFDHLAAKFQRSTAAASV